MITPIISSSGIGQPNNRKSTPEAKRVAVPRVMPTATRVIPFTAPVKRGLDSKHPKPLATMRITRNGSSNIPNNADTAPDQPKYRSPIIRAKLQTLGPGNTWDKENISKNSALDNHRFLSTKWRWATEMTPPKPCNVSKVKTKKISNRVLGLISCDCGFLFT